MMLRLARCVRRVRRGSPIAALTLCSGFALGQAKPEVKATLPLGVLAGKMTRFEVYGENLAPKEAAIKPPLTVKLLETKNTEGEAKSKGSRVVTVEVTVPKDTAAESFEMTLTQSDGGKFSAQVPVMEAVDTELEVKKPNTSFAQAMSLIGSSLAVNGTLDGDPALFKFEGKAGEVWQISLLAGRGGSQADTMLRIRNGRRLSLTLSAGPPKKDRKITFRVPADGPYYLEVQDSQSRGGKEMRYRLTLHRQIVGR